MRIFFTVLLLLSLLAAGSLAQTITVNTTDDTVNPNDGVTSLREAVDQANGTGGRQQIRFDAGVFAPNSAATIMLTGSLVLNDNSGADISGEGAEVHISAAGQDTLFFFKLLSGSNRIAHLNMHNAYGAAVLIDSLSTGNNDIGPGNRIHDIDGAGILVNASDNNHIHDNWVWNTGYYFITDQYMNGDGIVLLNGASANIIADNWCWFNDGSGIASYESHANLFTGNYSSRNFYMGLMVWQGNGQNELLKNHFFDNQSTEMYLTGRLNSGNQIMQNGIGDSTLIPDTLLQFTQLDEPLKDVTLGVQTPPFYFELEKQRTAGRNRAAGFRQLQLAKRHATDKNAAAAALVPGAPEGISYGGGLEIYGSSGNYIFGNNISYKDYGLRLYSGYDTTTYYPADNQIVMNIFINAYQAVDIGEAYTTTISSNIFRSNDIAIGAYGFYAQLAAIKNQLLVNSSAAIFITDNIFEHGGSGGIDKLQEFYYGGGAVGLGAFAYFEITGNRFRDHYAGVSLDQTGTGSIAENTFEDIYYYAVNAYGYDSLFIQSNNIINGSIYVDNYYETANLLQIADNHFGLAPEAAINLNYSDQVEILRNTIDLGGYYGIYLYDVDKALIEDNTIAKTLGSCLYAYQCDSLWLNNNRFLNATYTGVDVQAGIYLSAVGNDIFSSGENGIYAGYNRTVVLEGNDITLNGAGIGLYDNGRSEVRNNNILENKQSGVFVYGDTLVSLENNFISGNATGFYSYYLLDSEITGNTFAGNRDYGLYYDMYDDTLDATGNYWGHPSGPALTDTIYPGYTHGDRVSGNVRVDPFLTAPAFQPMVYPVVTHLEPAESPREGGSPFSAVGRQLLPGVMIYIDNQPAGDVFFAGTDRLFGIVPPGPGGWVDVVVVNPGGFADTLFNGFFYENYAPLPFGLVYPAAGATVGEPQPEFIWHTAPDIDGDPVEYIFMYSKFESFKDSIYVEDINDTTFVPAAGLDKNSTYYWRVLARDGRRGGYTLSETRMFKTDALSSVLSDQDLLPEEFALHQNYPNPFNPATRIAYDLKTPAEVQLNLYNMLGQKVATLVSGRQNAGRYVRDFNGSGLASGIYFYRIHITGAAESFVAQRKMLLVK